MISDRQGRKKMLIRAQAVAGVMIAIMGFAQNPPELFALRLLMGLASGVSVAAIALVVAETPRARVGWAIGMTNSAQLIAFSASPLAAGLLATVLPLRVVFVAGGLLMLCTTIPVAWLVKESSRGPFTQANLSIRRTLRAMGGEARTAILALLFGQLLIYLAYASGQQLILLRVIALNSNGSSVAIGIAFGSMGLAAGIAAAAYYRLVPRLGFRWLTIAAGLLSAAMFTGAAIATTTATVAIAAALAGLAFGVAGSALQSMLGLEAPAEIKATLFGVMGGVTSLGQGAGYLVAGLLAAATGLQAALSLAVATALLMAMVVWLLGREPSEHLTQSLGIQRL
jgi:MFS family permease